MKNRKRSSGFTLIEVMIVVVLIGILATIAAFTFLTTNNQTKVRNAARELSQSMQYAKMRAISTGVPHGIAFIRQSGNTPARYFMFIDCDGGDAVYTDSDTDYTNNTPVTSWNACEAATYDPRAENEAVYDLPAGVDYSTIFGGTSAPSGSELEYIAFNNLGQGVHGAQIVDGQVLVEFIESDGSGYVSGAQIYGSTGISERIPLRHK